MKQKKQQRLRGTQLTPRESRVTPNRDRGQVKPHGHKRLFKFDELSAQRLTSPETKVTTPAGKDALQVWSLSFFGLSVRLKFVHVIQGFNT